MTDAFPAGSMTWLLGIEDTCVYPPARFDMAPLDEHALTDHDLLWREDLAAVRELGASAVRYGVSWPLVHVAPGTFDWSVLDERMRYAAGDLGLTVIADLVHYGTPTWLEGSFADPRYPDAIAEFAGAFAARYRGLVEHLTPLNEPVTTASFCGLRGVWPPALSGWNGWTTVALHIVEGIRRTIATARAANPDVAIVHVEASAIYTATDPGLEAHADLLRSIAALPTDLLLGRVDDAHPMHGWLLEQGADLAVLDGFREDVPSIDLLGVNYYPDLTPRDLVAGTERGAVEQIAVNRWAVGLEDRLRWFAERYGAPMLVTETSIEGTGAIRSEWLTDSARAVLHLRESGLDIRGYTWWPLLDFVDWSWASGGRNVEEFLLDPGRDDRSAAAETFGDVSAGRSAFLRRMGLLALEEHPDGSLRRVRTPAAAAFEEVASSALEATDRVG